LHSLQLKKATERIKSVPVAVPSELSALLSLSPVLRHPTPSLLNGQDQAAAIEFP
jgi:hypothetical protein